MTKRWRNRFVVMLAAMCFLNLPCGAFAEEDQYLINESFEQEAGAKPSGWIFKENGGTVAVGSTEGTENNSNALNLLDIDKIGDSGVTAVLPFSEQKSGVVIETRFKLEGEMGSLILSVGGSTAEAIRITIDPNGTIEGTDGNATWKCDKTSARSGIWNTLLIAVQPAKESVNVRVNQEVRNGFTTKENCSESGINYLMFKTGSGTASVFIDSVTVKAGENLDTQAKPIQAPVVEAPNPRPVPGRINVNCNGEYVYFSYPPVMINDRVMIPLRKIFELFAMQVEWVEETKTAVISDETYRIEVTQDKVSAKVNGAEKILDVPAPVLNDRMYVPVRFIAENIGARVDWDETTQTVMIERREENK